MRPVKNTLNVQLPVSESRELINGKWAVISLVSSKLKDKENADNMEYKALRNRFYNSVQGGKYNVKMIAGVKCLDVDTPMKVGACASLEISFRRTK
jgi:hypothetical protein